MAREQDLGGVWYGRWDATHRDVSPNRFIAHLSDDAGQLGGTISEPDLVGITDIVTSSISGSRSGTIVRWTKQYDGSGRLAHAVHYVGSVNDDATQIRGDWRFEQYSGSFTMERELFDAAELEEERERALDLDG